MKPIDSLIMLFAVLSQIRKNKEKPEIFKGVRLYYTKSMKPISTEEFLDMSLSTILSGVDQQSISFEQIGVEEPAKVKE